MQQRALGSCPHGLMIPSYLTNRPTRWEPLHILKCHSALASSLPRPLSFLKHKIIKIITRADKHTKTAMPPTWNCKNIHVIGAQSTGKTTLVNALEKHFADDINSADGSKVSKPVIIREVARTVLDTHRFTRDDIVGLPSRALDLQKLILHAQLRAEEAALSGDSVDAWFISDRSGLDAIVHAKYFVGNEAAAEMISSADWKSLERTMRAGLVVLCEAGCAWLVDDGTRLMPKDVADWMRFDSVFREMLDTVDMHTLVIPKDLVQIQDRVQAVLDALGFPLVKQT